MFWDDQGVLLPYFQKCGENVNSASHCEVLFKLQDAIRRKLPGNWQEGYCFIMTMPDTIQLEKPRGEFKNYSGNFLSIPLTAWTWPLVTTIWSANHLGGRCFADDEEVKMEVRKWLTQQ
ncbi:hypothetical protein B7P43_G03780 [Cryptotermes secundus]|uniref:Uncharacterized protein n=1 Tax=Cryptotermes secundus TaxID=105785 RepID=A0A2J7R1X1_9NEOP|nr:hypothetical protein B7P43_G03780 [Cryptotermes secundus]